MKEEIFWAEEKRTEIVQKVSREEGKTYHIDSRHILPAAAEAPGHEAR